MVMAPLLLVFISAHFLFGYLRFTFKISVYVWVTALLLSVFITTHFLFNYSTVFDSFLTNPVKSLSSSFRLCNASVKFSVSYLFMSFLIAFAFTFPPDLDLSVFFLSFLSI